jgi:preprotein translocase subunit SecE
MFKKIGNYLAGVQTEMSKVNWPNRESLMESTAITLVLSIVLAIFIFLTDQIISRVINFIL